VVLEGKSIAENVALGVEDAIEEMIEEASRAALFHEFVRDLSDGYETILGGGGMGGVALVVDRSKDHKGKVWQG
jgi:ABC-type multidrug transport system fused ATPase/permease subunit